MAVFVVCHDVWKIENKYYRSARIAGRGVANNADISTIQTLHTELTFIVHTNFVTCQLQITSRNPTQFSISQS